MTLRNEIPKLKKFLSLSAHLSIPVLDSLVLPPLISSVSVFFSVHLCICGPSYLCSGCIYPLTFPCTVRVSSLTDPCVCLLPLLEHSYFQKADNETPGDSQRCYNIFFKLLNHFYAFIINKEESVIPMQICLRPPKCTCIYLHVRIHICSYLELSLYIVSHQVGFLRLSFSKRTFSCQQSLTKILLRESIQSS